MSIFDETKLPKYNTVDFRGKVIADLGAGAVGSHIVENAITSGIINVYAMDFDQLEYGNYSKSSLLYRYPEDVGRSKANALADGANRLLGEETVHGINANITMFGPMAFVGMDAILAPFDNYAAKIYINQQWLQIPLNLRPELYFGGTWGEEAQSNELDGKGPCLRCLHAEEWLVNPLKRTSCGKAPNYRDPDMPSASGVTTSLASRMAANLMTEQLRARLLGMEVAANKRILYTPFPNLNIKVSKPMKKKNCPDCQRFHPPANLNMLSDCDVMSLTLRELMTHLDALIKEDYYISVPTVYYAEAVYKGLIVDDYCRSCGIPIKGLYKHEFRQRYEDLLCDECRVAGKKASEDTRATLIGTKIDTLDKSVTDETVLDRTLFSLGWTIGGFIEVVVRGEGVDIMDDDFIKETYTFYCDNDKELLRILREVEG